jgi:hypothetical protein
MTQKLISPETGQRRKLKKVELMWISGNNTTSLAERLTKPRCKMWDVQWVIFASGYIPKEEWEELAQMFYAYFYADSKRDVMRAYQATLAMNISENATKYLQLFRKNKDNVIVPAQLRMAEMSTKKLSKTRKEEKASAKSQKMTTTERLLTLMSRSMGVGRPLAPSVWPRLVTTTYNTETTWHRVMCDC